MKRLFICTLLLMSLSATAYAQSEQHGDQQGQGQNKGQGQKQSRGGDHLVRMQKNLGLTDQQVAQMRQIRENGGSREEMRSVLTDEQRVLMQERRRQSQGKKGKGDPSRYYTQPKDSQAADPESYGRKSAAQRH
jgi:Spy/CpxP family protein refolding chaperone